MMVSDSRTLDDLVLKRLHAAPDSYEAKLRCADLFAGIGGFHVAARNLGLEVVYACEIDEAAQRAYAANYGLEPDGDITRIDTAQVPEFDLLFAGFPCQPFSIIGSRLGLADPRGGMFFEVLRFIRDRRPQAFILENVKQLATADHGSVLALIEDELTSLGYRVEHAILNALDFGLPQKRERTLIVGTLRQEPFPWPRGGEPMAPLSEILEERPDPKYFASPYIRQKRQEAHTADISPAIWHENKGGNVSSHPWSCALRAGASHNYLLVDGERRLTPREMLRLQGFPEDWRIVCNDSQTRRQAGNAVPVPMVQAVLERLVQFEQGTSAAWSARSPVSALPPGQYSKYILA